MRIRNSGPGFSGSRGDDRSSAFRHGRRPGQKVRGRLLKWVSDDMAWVEIEGHKLLAQLQSRPAVGTLLTFVIQQLKPNIVLKELYGASPVAATALDLASAFEASRALFENKFRTYATGLSAQSPDDRLTGFISLLDDDRKLLAAYMDVLNCAHGITHRFGLEKGHVLLYQPWLIPEGRRVATVVRPSPESGDSRMTATLVEFEASPYGLARIEFLHKDKETGYRLKIQHPDRKASLETYLNRKTRLTENIRCLGITKLRQREHGGILAELMFAQ
jgi:hypothetical protein